MQHRLQVLLAHQCQVDPLEELLSAWVYGHRSLQLCKLWEASHYHIVRLLYQIVLVGNSFEVSGELLLLRVEGFFLGLLTLMHEHQVIDDVDVG